MLGSLYLILFLVFSLEIYFINNLYVILGIFIISLLGIVFFKIRIRIYKTFLFILCLNFLLNYFLSNIEDAFLVTIRLIITFLWINILIRRISINCISLAIGNIFHSKTIFLIVAISLSFIPIMIEEIQMIKTNFYVKNYPLNLINIIKRPNILVVTFFTNIFKRIDDLENVLISRGIENF